MLGSCRSFFLALLLASEGVCAPPAETAPIALWPDGAPGDPGATSAEADATKPTDAKIAGRPVIRLGNVTAPTITLYRAPDDKATGAAVIVCPGGGYHILAYDLEGTEICEWLNSIGVTAVLLKYRVPAREGRPRYAAPLEDLQRAIGVVRLRATDWGVDPDRVGVLGFSAGGHLAALASTQGGRRAYDRVDDADDQSCQPDFALLIYPAYLTKRNDPKAVAAEFNITSGTAPTFLVQTQDDSVPVQSSIFYAVALVTAKVPVELHVYPTGGHGYGLRRSDHFVTTWPQRAEDWMRSRGLLTRASISK